MVKLSLYWGFILYGIGIVNLGNTFPFDWYYFITGVSCLVAGSYILQQNLGDNE